MTLSNYFYKIYLKFNARVHMNFFIYSKRLLDFLQSTLDSARLYILLVIEARNKI